MATPPKKPAGTRQRSTTTRGTATRRAGSTGNNPSAGKRAAAASSRRGNGNLGIALIVGAVAAVGALAAGALLALRGSSLADLAAPFTGGGEGTHGQTAHQPDGEDASASFSAGIADENTIPDHAVPLPG